MKNKSVDLWKDSERNIGYQLIFINKTNMKKFREIFADSGIIKISRYKVRLKL